MNTNFAIEIDVPKGGQAKRNIRFYAAVSNVYGEVYRINSKSSSLAYIHISCFSRHPKKLCRFLNSLYSSWIAKYPIIGVETLQNTYTHHKFQICKAISKDATDVSIHDLITVKNDKTNKKKDGVSSDENMDLNATIKTSEPISAVDRHKSWSYIENLIKNYETANNVSDGASTSTDVMSDSSKEYTRINKQTRQAIYRNIDILLGNTRLAIPVGKKELDNFQNLYSTIEKACNISIDFKLQYSVKGGHVYELLNDLTLAGMRNTLHDKRKITIIVTMKQQ